MTRQYKISELEQVYRRYRLDHKHSFTLLDLLTVLGFDQGDLYQVASLGVDKKKHPKLFDIINKKYKGGKMRVEHIEAKTRYEAGKKCSFGNPILAKVEGGYMAFESVDDYNAWKRQK